MDNNIEIKNPIPLDKDFFENLIKALEEATKDNK